MANERSVPGSGTRGDRATLNIVGLRRWHWSDAYHWILTLSWPRFFGLIAALYLTVNLGFAVIFYVVPGAVANARPGSFVDAFFFSIETLATVGYGYMHPDTFYGHAAASVEIMTGMLVIAVVTGLLFARFSRPTARMVFSDYMVVAPFNGVQTLMVRAANERNNLILSAAVRISLVWREKTQEGESFYRVHDLKLERETTSAFALSWTIMHKIDEFSPLYGKSGKDLIADGLRINVAISGLDETLNDQVHARRDYTAEQIMYGYRFADILIDQEDGVRMIDFRRFHEIRPDTVQNVSSAPR